MDPLGFVLDDIGFPAPPADFFVLDGFAYAAVAPPAAVYPGPVGTPGVDVLTATAGVDGVTMTPGIDR